MVVDQNEVHLEVVRRREEGGVVRPDDLMIFSRHMEVGLQEGYPVRIHRLEEDHYRLDKIYRQECRPRMLSRGHWRVCLLVNWKRCWAV